MPFFEIKKVLECQYPKFYLSYSMFKRIASILIILLAFVPLLSVAGVFKPGSPSRTTSSSLTIRWETSDESVVLKFQVYRQEYQSGGMGRSYMIKEIDAKRVNGSIYMVEDTEIFKTSDRVLRYDIWALDKDGNRIEVASMTTVFSTGLTSAARRTWGSIKAMFR